jgi:hypothetical protein
MSAINRFLLSNGFSIASNPCISPDFCLDWPRLHAALSSGQAKQHVASCIKLSSGELSLWEDLHGDHAWVLKPSAGFQAAGFLQGGRALPNGSWAYPATWVNLLRLKNILQEADPTSTVFPSTGGKLGQSTLGVGARFTTLHWPAVEWSMVALNLGMTANQNSIPRELVYDVDEMLAGKLDTVPFPFIGANVPEGHQGQSVEGMSHGCVLSKLKSGFHKKKIAWSFNADHQPIGGKFDVREDRLVSGCLLASYITFDLSPELAQTKVPADEAARDAWVKKNVPAALVTQLRARCKEANITLSTAEVDELLCRVWTGVSKMKVRDEKYRAIRERYFSTAMGRDYLRELSIDELPGLTTPATTAAMLSLCEALGMRIHFIAPAFGFQKNTPYPDNDALRKMIEVQWQVCRHFNTSIGFHSGSGKSGDNYRVMGQVTGSHLEIKTSGRYTYEMGRALFASNNPTDKALWHDWYRFTLDMAVAGSFSADPTEQKMARSFVVVSLNTAGHPAEPFSSPEACRAALEALKPSPEYMFFFEYNFLFVLAGGGRAEKASLGDHTPEGYKQRSRFYSISDEGRLRYAKNVATYLIFLAETTALASAARCAEARRKLEACPTYEAFIAEIGA